MKIFITGVCGYVGSRIALEFKKSFKSAKVFGIDNLSRHGSETSVEPLKKSGVNVVFGDVRFKADMLAVPGADWVIDCAANPSVLAGTKGFEGCGPEQLVDNNLVGTLNVLEYCRRHKAGLVLLSTSRVYSIKELCRIPLKEGSTRFEISGETGITGASEFGVSEEFSVKSPVSLYGATKLSSEIMAFEYGSAFGFPVVVNRSSVIGGPGQFGKIDQGIFSYWVYSYLLNNPLKYIGFGGKGKQVRDCVTAEDIASLIMLQIKDPGRQKGVALNIGGGPKGSMSLLEMTELCREYFGRGSGIKKIPENRQYDIPYFVADIRLAKKMWGWQPSRTAEGIVGILCKWAQKNRKFVELLLN